MNDRTSVQCVVVTGDLPLNFTWLKDGLPLRITSSSLSGVSIRQNDDFTSALSIINIMVVDAGSYTCRVQNDAATVEHVAPLSVNGNHRVAIALFHQSFALHLCMSLFNVVPYCAAYGTLLNEQILPVLLLLSVPASIEIT